MVLSDTAIRRPVLATVISLLIVVLGIASLLQLPVREYPDIDPPIVSISTDYVGAAPGVMDTEVTEVIEESITSVDGIRNITSESRDGRSEIDIEFDTDQNVDAAANDVRDAVGRIQGDLPDDADPPVVEKAEADAQPMMWLSLTSDRLAAEDVTDYAERQLVERLSVLDGVARVRIGGERRYAMRVWLDRQALAARGLTVPDVEEALRRENVELPAGEVESAERKLTVRTDTRYEDAGAFRDLVVHREGDYLVRLGEVAEVERGVEDDDTRLRMDGSTAIGLGIIRQSQANTISVADGVMDEIDALRPNLPEGMDVIVGYDESQFVRESIKEVVRTLLIAVLLVILTIFVFLRSVRATFIPAVTIPVAVIGAFSVMAPLGFSINVLTLLALILAIGLVVDDAIVVLENIQRRIDEGEPPLLAAYRGTRQVAFAVIATTVSLIAVFVPIAFMEGNVGRLFTEFGLVLAAAVAFSSLVALTLGGMLCSKWLRLRDPSRTGRIERGTERFFTGLAAGYRWLLQRALNLPVVVVAAALSAAGMAWTLYEQLPEELTPTEDRGVFIVPATAPEGSTSDHTDRSIREIEDILNPLLHETEEANRVLAIQGWGGVSNRGIIIVGLKPWDERDRSQQEIVAEMMPRILGVPGLQAFAVNPPGLGQSSFEEPVQFVIGGNEYEEVGEWADRVAERARDHARLQNVDTNYEDSRPQLDVRVDRDRAADLGVGARDIGLTLQTLFASRDVTTYLDRGREYDVILEAADQDRATPADLNNLYIRGTRADDLIPLGSLIDLSERGAPPVLHRVDRLPSVTVTASLAPGYDLGSALDYLNEVAAEEIPDEARISYLGLSDEFMQAGGAILVTFALALLIVFLVLSAQFESFIHPFVILTAVPLAVTGALGALLFTGNTLNIYSQIGMILLVGLMTKNGILIVEFANQLRDQHYSVREAILQGATLRFRPVLMTALSTIIGATPLVLSTGAGAESRAAIGTVIIGGMGFATLLTLFVVPVLYDLLARFTTPVNVVADELERLESEYSTVHVGRGPGTTGTEEGHG